MSPALLLIAALGAAPQAELLDFTATWCGPCQQMKPIVERLRREGFPIRPIDVDQHRDLAKHYQIKGIPAFVLIVNGQEAGRAVGAQSESTLRQLLAKIPAAPATAVATDTAPAPKKKSWFPMPWAKKEEPPAEPPRFEEVATTENPVVLGQSPDAPAAPAVPAHPPAAAKDPLQTAVRIRVKDDKGIDFGSGTVIGSRDGRALVLTCWHIFREFGKTAAVEVDLFPNGPGGPPQTFPGKLVCFNEKADVALVLVTGCGALPVSPVSATDQFPKEGDHVFSVGCGEGKEPSKIQHVVTRLNPYVGPDTTECTGMPVVGRSGGGLFDAKGRVIGVCFAADREDERGVYVGPTEIHKLIGEAGYAALIPTSSAATVAGTEAADSPAETPAVAATSNPFGTTGAAPADASPAPAQRRPEAAARPVEAAAVAALDASVPMEATIILRPLDKIGAASEVIVINKVSNRFHRYLKGEFEPAPVETGLRVPVRSLDRERLVTADLFKACVRSAACGVLPPSAGVALLVRVFDNHR